MKIKQLVDEDFVNYKLPSMFIGFPICDFKCEKECGLQVCQNSALATSSIIDIDALNIIKRYVNNSITKSIIIGGLEPFDTFNQLIELIKEFRKQTDDDIIIFTGYYKEEKMLEILKLSKFKNIIIKFGRYIPNQESHLDKILGIYLASKNQYAERIS